MGAPLRIMGMMLMADKVAKYREEPDEGVSTHREQGEKGLYREAGEGINAKERGAEAHEGS